MDGHHDEQMLVKILRLCDQLYVIDINKRRHYKKNYCPNLANYKGVVVLHRLNEVL